MTTCNEPNREAAPPEKEGDGDSGRGGARIDDAILDAARSCVLDFGVRRSSLAEVARRAGVSRPTVYRRWPDMRSLVADLLTRELRVSIELTPIEAPGGVDGQTNARAALVTMVVHTSRLVREHPLFVKIFRTDPDIMMTYIAVRLGRSQRAAIDHVCGVIALGQQDGSIRAGDPVQIAAMILLVTQSAVQSATMISELLDAQALDEQLRANLDGYLRPHAETPA